MYPTLTDMLIRRALRLAQARAHTKFTSAKELKPKTRISVSQTRVAISKNGTLTHSPAYPWSSRASM